MVGREGGSRSFCVSCEKTQILKYINYARKEFFMTLQTQTALGSHQFDGPHTTNSTLPSMSGAYLITTITPSNQHAIIDVGESHNIQNRISNHDRTAQWKSNIQNGLHAWVLTANESERMLIEKAHRLVYNPVCGER